MDTFFHSVRLDKDKCKGCTNCIKRCPTEAIRVREGKAHIISERCIDCGECIRVCPHHAKYAYRGTLEQLKQFKYNIALPPPSLYGQFKNLDDVNFVLDAILSLGFDRVYEVSKAAELVSDATRRLMENGNLPRPVISSACPAVVRLIRIRYPELLKNVLPLEPPVEEAARLARSEAVKTTGLSPEEIGVFFLSPCPAKITAINHPLGLEKSNLDGSVAINDIYPLLVKYMDKLNEPKNLRESGIIGISWATSGGEATGTLSDNALSADGVDNCIQILEEAERGTLDTVEFIELNACQGGCVGGVLTAENPYIAKNRLMRIRKFSPVSCNHLPDGTISDDTFFSEPIEPCDEVLKLADNVTEAMNRMNRMKELLTVFPGLDCGTCGAPSCKALAEDIVRGFASDHDCVFRMKQDLEKLGGSAELNELIPAPFRESQETEETKQEEES